MYTFTKVLKSYNAEIFLYEPWRPKVCFQCEIIMHGLEYHVMGLRPLDIFLILSVQGSSLKSVPVLKGLLYGFNNRLQNNTLFLKYIWDG